MKHIPNQSGRQFNCDTNATTKKSPFDLIMGYMPTLKWSSMPSPVPSVTTRLSELEKIQEEVLRNIYRAQKAMKIGNLGNKKFRLYKEGDQVWIKGTNLKTLYPLAKLGPKSYRPFKILKQLSEAVY